MHTDIYRFYFWAVGTNKTKTHIWDNFCFLLSSEFFFRRKEEENCEILNMFDEIDLMPSKRRIWVRSKHMFDRLSIESDDIIKSNQIEKTFDMHCHRHSAAIVFREWYFLSALFLCSLSLSCIYHNTQTLTQAHQSERSPRPFAYFDENVKISSTIFK